eukprot:scaffold3437_cov113-Cylindrotheca_fusiformis.AAC.4
MADGNNLVDGNDNICDGILARGEELAERAGKNGASKLLHRKDEQHWTKKNSIAIGPKSCNRTDGVIEDPFLFHFLKLASTEYRSKEV